MVPDSVVVNPLKVRGQRGGRPDQAASRGVDASRDDDAGRGCRRLASSTEKFWRSLMKEKIGAGHRLVGVRLRRGGKHEQEEEDGGQRTHEKSDHVPAPKPVTTAGRT